MPQVVQHTHEQNEIELLVKLGDLVDGKIAKLDFSIADLRGETRLGQVLLIRVDRYYAIRFI
jgi:hypothetical protein